MCIRDSTKAASFAALVPLRIYPSESVPAPVSYTHLDVYKRQLVASYEALRFQRLDLFTVTLRLIGAYIAASRFQDAVNEMCIRDRDTPL